MATCPEMPGTALEVAEVSVTRVGEDVSLIGCGASDVHPEAEVLDAAHGLVRRVLLAETQGGILLHAASARVKGKYVALVGDKGAGKTTLALKLLSAGHDVFGDEHMFIDADKVMTRPRTLRVKETSLGMVPDLDGRIEASPFLVNWDGGRIFAVKPEGGQQVWRLEPYQLDHIVHLLPNHSSASRLSPAAPAEMFSVAMEQSFLPHQGRGKVLSYLWRVVAGAAAWTLHLGDLDDALAELEKLGKVH